MTTPLLLFSAAFVFAIAAIYFFLSNEKETKKLLDAEDKLEHLTAQEKTKLMSVISGLADGVIVLDSMFRPWVINDAARTFLTITKQNPTFEDITRPFPIDLRLDEKIKEAISFDRLISLHEIKIADRMFQMFITPVSENHNGTNHEAHHIIGATILMQDITTEKSLEKMKEDFSHMIVHELRAPIAAVKDASSMLIKQTDLKEDERMNMLQLIHDQSNKLLIQVSSILDAAKIEEGKLTINKTIGDIAQIARDQVDLFLPEAKRKNITLIAEIGNSLPLISIDNVRIPQVINNLISNSLKYSNEHGVIKLTVDTDQAYQENKDNGSIVVSVTDNGIGIPQEKQNVLFTKFGQIANKNISGTTQKLSSGLGLYITRGIIEAHGGKISVKSEAGRGTTITFTLPISHELDQPTAPLIASVKNQAVIPPLPHTTTVH